MYYRAESFLNGWWLDKKLKEGWLKSKAELGHQMKEEVNKARVLPL